MSQETAAPILRPVNYLLPGDKRTFLSASFANQAIAAVNAVAMMRVGEGLRIAKAATGIVIELDDSVKDKLDEVTPGGGGDFSFQGEYDALTAYTAGDVVIAWDQTSMTDGYAGTYVCLQDCTGKPLPVGEDFETAYWRTVSRGHWHKLEVRDYGTEANGHTTINGGHIRIQIGASGPYVALDDTYAGYDSALNGKTFMPRVVDVCEDGVVKKMGILATETWEP